MIINSQDNIISTEDDITCFFLCRYLPDLPDHLPHDCRARCGGLCLPAPAARPWYGHHLLRHVDQNQPHLPHLWTRQEVGDSAKIHQPHLPAHYHLRPHFCPGENFRSPPAYVSTVCHMIQVYLFVCVCVCVCVCVLGPRCVCVVCRRPSSHHHWLWGAPPSEPQPCPRHPEVWHVWPVNHLLPQLQHRTHGNILIQYRSCNVVMILV